MSTQHTPGPWRWEVNAKSKQVQLRGGKARHDLTVIDFARCGFGSATPRFREMSEPGMNIMRNALEFATPKKGREHHAAWFQILMHPDAALIEAAPELLEALEEQERVNQWLTVSDPDDPFTLETFRHKLNHVAKLRGAAITKARRGAQ